MRSEIENWGVGAILRLLPVFMFAVWVVAVVMPTVAENGASQTAPPSQTDSGYWTPEKMRSAKPLMPTVPGTPASGSAASRPSGPTGGSPGRDPDVRPSLPQQRQ